jgi:hypothetical protein
MCETYIFEMGVEQPQPERIDNPKPGRIDEPQPESISIRPNLTGSKSRVRIA